MLNWLVGLAVLAMATVANAMTQDQENAAKLDGALAIAETRCALKVPPNVVRAMQGAMHPVGFDRAAQQLRIKETERLLPVWKRDPVAFCEEMKKAYGTEGVIERGLLTPK